MANTAVSQEGKDATYIDKVSTLNHKVFDNAMKYCSLETGGNTITTIFTSTKLTEIFTSLWNNIRKQLENNPTNFLEKIR